LAVATERGWKELVSGNWTLGERLVAPAEETSHHTEPLGQPPQACFARFSGASVITGQRRSAECTRGRRRLSACVLRWTCMTSGLAPAT
jgi:hypothetical protein